MLIAVTKRPDIITVHRQACAAAPLQGGRVSGYSAVSDIGDAAEYGNSVAILALDLELCMQDPRMLETLAQFRNINPTCAVVLIRTLADKEQEGALLFDLGRLQRPNDACVPVSTALSTQFWVTLILRNPLSCVLREIRDHFEHLLPSDTPNRSLILQMLTTAASNGSVDALARALASPMVSDSTKRVHLWEVLTSAEQPPAREFLTAFTVAINARLLELHAEDVRYWQPEDRALALGFADSRALRRSLQQRTGYRWSELRKLSYTSAAQICVGMARPEPSGAARSYKRMLVPVLGLASPDIIYAPDELTRPPSVVAIAAPGTEHTVSVIVIE